MSTRSSARSSRALQVRRAARARQRAAASVRASNARERAQFARRKRRSGSLTNRRRARGVVVTRQCTTPRSMGGVMEAAVLQPIDVIKTRLQLDTAGKYHGE